MKNQLQEQYKKPYSIILLILKLILKQRMKKSFSSSEIGFHILSIQSTHFLQPNFFLQNAPNIISSTDFFHQGYHLQQLRIIRCPSELQNGHTVAQLQAEGLNQIIHNYYVLQAPIAYYPQVFQEASLSGLQTVLPMKQILNQHFFPVELAHYSLRVALLGSSEDVHFKNLPHAFQECEKMWPVYEAV